MHHLRTAFSRRLAAILFGICLLPLVVPARAAVEADAFAAWLRGLQVMPEEAAPSDADAFDAALARASAQHSATLAEFLGAFASAYESEGGTDLGAFFSLPEMTAARVVDVLASQPEPTGFRAIFPRPVLASASGTGLAGLSPSGGLGVAVLPRALEAQRLLSETRRAAPVALRLVFSARLLIDASPLGP